MHDVVLLRIPRGILERLEKESRKAGLTPEEYIIELILNDLDPPERAREYIEAAKSFLEEAEEELRKGNMRQAAEKLWGAAALAIKAYASWRSGKRLTSHGELWEYTRVLRRELGTWISDAWAHANAMHVCFYEGWCSREHIEDAREKIEKLVRAVEGRVKAEG
ncbi:PaREP1 family protein [Pyrolobus fumarii 1A]|uniref:PaREP1 family protein n=1 Tax=Pyrolobus fumarii (strain DSM 11204 / 1A) TaxID=694429 RepID=G0EDE1_PYRF1|nr:PaREP1 family protein [Pyrolobus fumarii]AEM38626.1 PaREP1 family protein [Pyrolobus fumarii 1A]